MLFSYRSYVSTIGMHKELLVRCYLVIPYKGLTSMNKPQKCQDSRFPVRQGWKIVLVARKVRSACKGWSSILGVERVDNSSTP
jgi:hypothetical protein